MCFSAAASFGLSGVLAGVGTASIARSTSRAMRVLASTPLIFGVQQAAEGTVWLTLGPTAHASLHRLSVALFLGIALVVWPLWAPISLRLIEQSDTRRRVLTGLCGLGFVVSAVAVTLLARWQPIATVAGHSVSYEYAATGLPLPQFVFLLVYASPAVGPFFVSSMRMAPTIGGTLVLSLVVAILIQREALTSVWCFFAAFVSVLILVAVSRRVS